jgi:hypothetical protein
MINLINHASATTLTPEQVIPFGCGGHDLILMLFETLTLGQVIPFGCGGYDLILMVFESTTTYTVSVYQQ